MKARTVLLRLCLTVLMALSVVGVSLQTPLPVLTVDRDLSNQIGPAALLETHGQLPLSFEANRGQTDGRVKYLARGPGYSLFLTATEAVLSLGQPSAPTPQDGENTKTIHPAVLRMGLVGANPQPDVAGLKRLPGQVNYFIGNDPAKWQRNAPTYAQVEYRAVYPGVDLVYYGDQGQLEYDFVVAPGADPSVITLGLQGADQVEMDARGDLLLRAGRNQVRLRKPFTYQETAEGRREVPSRYLLSAAKRSEGGLAHQVRFQLAAYDTSRPLVIDPVLAYSTFLGGGGDEFDLGIALDAAGNVYVKGATSSTDFPLESPLQPTYRGGSHDMFVTKLNPAGDTLIYSTYLGGNGFDGQGRPGIAVDAEGNVLVAGSSTSSNFPTVNPLQPTRRGTQDAVLAKLKPGGDSLVFSTYLGGHGVDIAEGLVLDSDGNAYLHGWTSSRNFPMVNPIQSVYGGGNLDAFVAKLSPAGDALAFSTYLGGSNTDVGWAIALDASNHVYLAGHTRSTNFPLANALQPAYGGGRYDAFVAKLDLAANTLVYSTYLGGSGQDIPNGIAVGPDGSAYLTGGSASTDFPLASPLQPDYAGGAHDVFLTKLNAAGDSLVYSTYLGGGGDDVTVAIAVDSAGRAHLVGGTGSTDFPLVDPLQPTYGGGSFDAFMTTVDALGERLAFSTFLGGDGEDVGHSLALGADGTMHLVGRTGSGDFPTSRPLQPTYGGGRWDTFVAKLAITPQAQIQLLIENVYNLVTGGVLNEGQGNALISKLEAALQQLDRCNVKAARNQLEAFLNQVNAFLRAGILTPEQGQPLIQAAQAIIDQLDDMTLLTPAGGRLILSPNITLSAGPGTFPDTVRVDCAPHAPLATDPLHHIGLFFELNATYLDGSPAQPELPYTLTLTYDQADVPPRVSEAMLAVYSQDDQGNWVEEPSSVVDVAANTLTAQPDHFSLWAVLAADPQSVYLPGVFKDWPVPPSSR